MTLVSKMLQFVNSICFAFCELLWHAERIHDFSSSKGVYSYTDVSYVVLLLYSLIQLVSYIFRMTSDSG